MESTLTFPRAVRFLSRDGFNKTSKGRRRIAFDVERNHEQSDQILGEDLVLRPLGDLAQIMLRLELFDLHADDLGEAGGELLSDSPLFGGKIETDKRDFEGPIRSFGSDANHEPA